MSNTVIIVTALAAIGIILIAAICFYLMQGSSRKSLVTGDIWNEFVKKLKSLDAEGKKVGMMVTIEKKYAPIGENIDKLILPAFEFAVDQIHRSGVIHHVSMNSNKNNLPPNCHVFVVFRVELEGNKYVIKPTYHTTNITGTLSRDPLRYRPDTLKLTSDDLKKFSKRDSMCDSFRQEFPGFIAAVARKQ